MFLKHALGALAALVVSTNPAMANETATSTQITGAIDAANASSASGDREFRELFASWKSMDRTGVVTANPIARVSIPSGMPVQDATLTSNFGMRNHPILGGRRNHKGVDLAEPVGTPVYATADGLVSKAAPFSSYGNYIQIEHGGGLQTRFAHLSGFAVATGDQVHKGQLIGYVGTTGRSTGPHLHYEIRVAGEAVDPTPYMVSTDLAVSDDPALGRGGAE
jgi:murein DD-endopeptidase MepM/ murein hydrolase activator NlpD